VAGGKLFVCVVLVAIGILARTAAATTGVEKEFADSRSWQVKGADRSILRQQLALKFVCDLAIVTDTTQKTS
jgi:hypothetical protein